MYYNITLSPVNVLQYHILACKCITISHSHLNLARYSGIFPQFFSNKNFLNASPASCFKCSFNDAFNYGVRVASVVGECINMVSWWNDTDRRKKKYSENSLSQWHFAHQKSHVNWVEMVTWPPAPPKTGG
jgi:hypothetical protein